MLHTQIYFSYVQARLLHSEISLGENINNGVENPENRSQQGSGDVSENHKQESGGFSENQPGSEGEKKEQLRGEREINESEESEKTSDANVDVEAKEEDEEEEEDKEEDKEEEEDYDDIWDDYEYDYLEETEAQVTKRPTVDFARFKLRSNQNQD